MQHPLDRDEIPVCEGTEEKNEVWEQYKESDEPFVILQKVELGYMPKYDLYTTDKKLTDDAASDVNDWIGEWVEIYTAELEDTKFTRDELSYHAGKSSGAIWPLEREEALNVAEEISEILSDDSNLDVISPRDAFFGDAD